MKTAISIPNSLYEAAERAAKGLGVSRSELYQRAIAEFLERRKDMSVRETLDRVYEANRPATLDPVLEQLQRASLPHEDW